MKKKLNCYAVVYAWVSVASRNQPNGLNDCCSSSIFLGSKPCQWKHLVLLKRENDLPIVPHSHDRPAPLLRFLQCRDQLTAALGLGVIGVLALSIGVVDNQAKTRMRIVNGRVFQHCLVAIAVAKTGSRAAANELVNPDGLSVLVVYEQMFRCFLPAQACVKIYVRALIMNENFNFSRQP